MKKKSPAGSGSRPASKLSRKAAPAPAKQARTSKPAAAPPDQGAWAAAFAERRRGEKRYWLVKSEPGVFSFDDLLAAPNATTFWDGVRNFTARNFLRDGMKAGDRVLFYHSMAGQQSIAGICEVVREGYPDPTQHDPRHANYDEKSDPAAPRWFMVDVRAVKPMRKPVTLSDIKSRSELAQMALLRIGRLSVTPVTAAEWKTICEMGGVSAGS